MDVTYLRYQDDVIVFCQTKRQLQRCKQRLLAVLKERRLSLSRKKTRIGSTDKEFHFLGINYPGTQPLDRTNVTQAPSSSAIQSNSVHYLSSMGGEDSISIAGHSALEQKRIVPHARTLRHARENVKQMVIDGVSLRRIKSYLHRWCTWWVRTVTCWTKHELLVWFLDVCWNDSVKAVATILLNNINQTNAWEQQRSQPALPMPV